MAGRIRLKPESVLPNSTTGMDDHAVADESIDDRCTRPNGAITADMHIWADDRSGPDHGSRSDCGSGPNHCSRIDHPSALNLCRGMHNCFRCHPLCLEQRGWAQGVWVELARYQNKGTIRFVCVEHVDSVRRLLFEALGRQAGAGLGRHQSVGIFGRIEKGEVRPTCSIEGRNIGNEMIVPNSTSEFGSREGCNLAHGQTRRALVEMRRSHAIYPLYPTIKTEIS